MVILVGALLVYFDDHSVRASGCIILHPLWGIASFLGRCNAEVLYFYTIQWCALVIFVVTVAPLETCSGVNQFLKRGKAYL